MPSLYELTGERLSLQSKLESLDIDAECIADTLEGSSGELQAKIEDYGFVIRNMESFTDAMKAEETRMATRRKAHENRVTKIKEWLLQNMQACQISKIECPAFTIALKTNPPKVVIDNEELITDDYKLQPPTPPMEISKARIAGAFKQGLQVVGAHQEQSQRIEIK